MFVAVALDPGSPERAKELVEILGQYGFAKVQRGLWESTSISAAGLAKLKYELDRATDAYDKLRVYQYPVDDVLIVSGLKEKRWKRLVPRKGR